MKLKKRRKSSRMHGRGRGTHGWGARKKHVSSGNQAGFGMSGTGKMAGHRKSLVIKLYGTEYFGKQGVTSRSSKRRHNKVMNLQFIDDNLHSLTKKHGQKDGTINLEDYKILGEGEIKQKIIIKAAAASKSAIEKIEKAGGKILLEETETKED